MVVQAPLKDNLTTQVAQLSESPKIESNQREDKSKLFPNLTSKSPMCKQISTVSPKQSTKKLENIVRIPTVMNLHPRAKTLPGTLDFLKNVYIF